MGSPKQEWDWSRHNLIICSAQELPRPRPRSQGCLSVSSRALDVSLIPLDGPSAEHSLPWPGSTQGPRCAWPGEDFDLGSQSGAVTVR